jgi:hypothetical protein
LTSNTEQVAPRSFDHMEWSEADKKWKQRTKRTQELDEAGMAGWNRPALCLLCKGPGADGSVRVDTLDAEKLSEWWGRTLLCDLNRDDVKHHIICEFCVWQAK